jgi:arylsulfatase A-like enzyme
MVRNVLLVVADQWRGDALGGLGHPAAITPNLDALAAEGVLFRRHFGQSAPCGPARASLLTGLYVMNHRVVANGVPLDARHATLPVEARRGGIDPCLIGYTTTIPDPRGTAPDDPRFAEIGDVMEGWRVVAHFDEVRFRTWAAWVAAQGFPVPDDPAELWMPAEGPPGPTAAPARIPAHLSDTAWSAAHAEAFLRAPGRRDRPWLLHLGFFRPHPPFAAPAPWHAAVPEAAIPPPVRAASREAEAAQHPLLAHWLGAQWQAGYFQGARGRVADLMERDLLLTRRAYFGLIAEIDAALGRVFGALRDTGQWGETLVVFTADHGEQLGDHGLLGKLGWFDGSYHLPLIVRDPDAPAAARGRVVEALTEAVDVIPTLLDRLGLPVPPACDGVPLTPWLRGETPAAWRDAVHFEYDLRGGWPDPWSPPLGLSVEDGAMAAMRTARWKYVHFAGALPPVLHDLAEDPGETRNLAADPARAPLLVEARGRMLSWRLRHADRTLTHLCATPAGLRDRRDRSL